MEGEAQHLPFISSSGSIIAAREEHNEVPSAQSIRILYVKKRASDLRMKKALWSLDTGYVEFTVTQIIKHLHVLALLLTLFWIASRKITIRKEGHV